MQRTEQGGIGCNMHAGPTFLPFLARLFCMSAGVGNLPESHVKYLRNINHSLKRITKWLPVQLLLNMNGDTLYTTSPSTHTLTTVSTSFHQCALYPATAHHMECHVHQTPRPHCTKRVTQYITKQEAGVCQLRQIYFFTSFSSL